MTVTKRAFKLAQRCPRLAWYAERIRLPLDESSRWRMETGNRIGEIARQRYSDGVLLPWNGGHELTQETMASEEVKVVFEASFKVGDLVARTDVLERVPGGWRLTEFKSGASVKSDYEQEAFFQAHVLELAGVPLQDVCIGFVNSQYEWPGGEEYDPMMLLSVASIWEKREKWMPKIEAGVLMAREALCGDDGPQLSLARRCFRPDDCGYLTQCHPEGDQGTIFHIPDLFWRDADKLVEQGIVFSKDIVDEAGLKESTRRTLASARDGAPDVDDDLFVKLDQIKFPAFFLDFETVGSALPIFPKTRPFQVMQFQWSGHMVDAPDQPETEWRHFEYLPDDRLDPRERFCQSLLPHLREAATVIHYSAFEAQQLSALNEAAIQGAEECHELLQGKAWDLHAAIKDHVFDAAFMGKTSIKLTLPALVPGLSYNGLEIKDGNSAQAAYMRMISPESSETEVDQIRKDLLAYCKLDTEAMVRIYQALLALRGN